jgi:hypothetical protein
VFLLGRTKRVFEKHRGQFHYRRTAFSSQLKPKIGNIFAKAAALRITLNIDVTPLTSRSHTYPSYSQTSRLLNSSLSLGFQSPTQHSVCETCRSLCLVFCLSSQRHSYISLYFRSLCGDTEISDFTFLVMDLLLTKPSPSFPTKIPLGA